MSIDTWPVDRTGLTLTLTLTPKRHQWFMMPAWSHRAHEPDLTQPRRSYLTTTLRISFIAPLA